MYDQRSLLEYICRRPDQPFSAVVESIWMVKNYCRDRKEAIIVPDGKIDLFLLSGEDDSFEIFISGICTEPIVKPPFPESTMFAISFYPLAAEYIFKHSFADLSNAKRTLSHDYWGFSRDDLGDFELFYQKAFNIIFDQKSKAIDPRKQKLFDLIHSSKGEVTVNELAEKVSWSSRQMNRYFRSWFGITLKSYINTIRFSNSLKQLNKGKLYPELNYGDQSHFIREVKKFTGVKPTLLSKNENDRFIQLILLQGE